MSARSTAVRDQAEAFAIELTTFTGAGLLASYDGDVATRLECLRKSADLVTSTDVDVLRSAVCYLAMRLAESAIAHGRETS
ncbi:MAG TPA: hypothetical protein VFU07_07305 [Candidatus Lumbricidophila sp.]|nr:hypothetical protein [Candidatus Lumbricidophila sp.]